MNNGRRWGGTHGSAHGPSHDQLYPVEAAAGIQASLEKESGPQGNEQPDTRNYQPLLANGLIPPPADSNERNIWNDYPADGLDCLIRACRQGRHQCGWRPKDRASGFKDMSRVKYDTIPHDHQSDYVLTATGHTLLAMV